MRLWFLAVACGCVSVEAGDGDGDDRDSDSNSDHDGDNENDSGGDSDLGSVGCGKLPADAAGGVSVVLDAGLAGDGLRSFHLSRSSSYDPDVPHALVIGYAGTDWVGEQIQPYLDLEGGADNELFVYPDPLWRDFDGWGTYGGWVLGPYADPADGNGDLVFTEALLDYMEEFYCIDTDRVFVTGHSWGGDMAAVAACFLGDRVTAAVPVAANRPYWFDTGIGWATCAGQAAVWTLFGVADDHFTWQDYNGQFGDEQVEFWVESNACDGLDGTEPFSVGAGETCVSYSGCAAETRYCLYGPETAHQVPGWYSVETIAWFREF